MHSQCFLVLIREKAESLSNSEQPVAHFLLLTGEENSRGCAELRAGTRILSAGVHTDTLSQEELLSLLRYTDAEETLTLNLLPTAQKKELLHRWTDSLHQESD